MFDSKFFASLSRRVFGKPTSRRTQRPRFVPRLEALEDRRVPATFTVANLNDSGTGSLRQAIADANTISGADDVVFQTGLPGTISLTSGEMPITDSVTITGNGAANSVIDAQQASRIFNVTGTAGNVTLAGLTLTNGRINSGVAQVGGAVFFRSSGTLTVSQSVLSGNSATITGGAIHALQGSVMVSQSTLSGNSASVGGAIFGETAATVAVMGSALSGNAATASGGAISVGNNTNVIRSTFSGNTANTGGAISLDAGVATVTQSTFSSNTAANRGAAIFAGAGTTTISQSTVWGNAGASVIYADTGALTLTQSTVAANIPPGTVAVIHSESAPLTIRNSIVGSNQNASAPELRLSPDAGDAFVLEFSLIGKNTGTSLTATGSTTPDANGNLIGDSAGISPLLGSLADNGGPTVTSALLAGSPALNRGSNTLASTFTTDQRGAPFARVFGGTVDMGAFEAQTLALGVDTNVDEDDGNYSAGDLSLREAIRLTNANPGADTITFAASTNGTDFDLSLGEMTINDTVTITGNGTVNTVIDAQRLSRIFDITVKLVEGVLTSGNLSLFSLSLINGKTTGAGGAVLNRIGSVTVTGCTLSGNSADQGGGAISGSDGAVTVTDSTLSGNSAGTFGGAISANNGAITVTQSTLSGNIAGIQGGAIRGSSGAITVTQSTLSGNSAVGRGGGVFTEAGGGIYSESAPITIRNSIVASNTDGSGTAPDVRKSPDAADAFEVEFSLIGKNPGTGLTATGSTTPDASGNLIGDSAGIDPKLAALANNGGPTQTMALLAGSPAFNRGSNTIAAPFTFDQRGTPFGRILSGTVDMGAFESPPWPTSRSPRRHQEP